MGSRGTLGGVTVVTVAPGRTRTEFGGPNAMNIIEEAITGVNRVLDRLTIADSGTYWNFDGKQVPW